MQSYTCSSLNSEQKKMSNIFYYCALFLYVIPKSSVSLLNIESVVEHPDNNDATKSNLLQNIHSEETDQIELNNRNARISSKYYPTDQISLALVFDATASMANDLKLLQNGVQNIVNKFTSNEDNPIYNYIFVPFRMEDGKIGL